MVVGPGARDYLSKEEFEALKASMWFDPESKQLIVNGHPETGSWLAAYSRYPRAW